VEVEVGVEKAARQALLGAAVLLFFVTTPLSQLLSAQV
jgi:hypothetical protein